MVRELVIVTVILLLFTHCAPVYTPNTRNIPDLDKPGELKLTGMFSTSGFGLNSNILVTDHLGLMINGSVINQGDEKTERSREHTFGEVGVGFHHKIGIANFALYINHGYGKSLATEVDTALFINTYFAKGIYSRTSIQPSFSFVRKVLIPAFAIRISRVHFSEYYEETTSSFTSETGYFFEPAFQLGMHQGPYEFDVQLGISLAFEHDEINFNYVPIIAAIGLAYRFNYE
ncbi:MAG: hypothetical protein ACNS60_02440 [Candidatus Cyclobacteriaceae bacterium M2_1C_046]